MCRPTVTPLTWHCTASYVGILYLFNGEVDNLTSWQANGWCLAPTCPSQSRPNPHCSSQRKPHWDSLSLWKKFYPLAASPSQGCISFSLRYVRICNSSWSGQHLVAVLRRALNLTCALSPPEHPEETRTSKYRQRVVQSHHPTFAEPQKWWMSSITFVYVYILFFSKIPDLNFSF